MSASSITDQLDTLPDHFSVAVIMQRSPSQVSKWSDHQWQAVGVTVIGDETPETSDDQEAKLIHEAGDIKQYLYSGFEVKLYRDECESYYHNLMSPTPRCYVIAREDEEDETPIPFLVSLSFDEAHAYLESDDLIFDVDIPPELYRWTETFVLTHYAPEKRKKRKRDDWKNPSSKPV